MMPFQFPLSCTTNDLTSPPSPSSVSSPPSPHLGSSSTSPALSSRPSSITTPASHSRSTSPITTNNGVQSSSTARPKPKGKPRILCLHGGGSSALIFSLQSRSLIRALSEHFTLIFADGPLPSCPGPGVAPVYKDEGPFWRWARWLPTFAEVPDDAVVEELVSKLLDVIEGRAGIRGLGGEGSNIGAGAGADHNQDCYDDYGYACPSEADEEQEQEQEQEQDGDWVGILGFSQGAMMAASLLLDQQLRQKDPQSNDPLSRLPHFRFGLLFNGRGPLQTLSPRTAHPSLLRPSQVSSSFSSAHDVPANLRVRVPTLHVHGLADPGLAAHRQLLRANFENAAAGEDKGGTAPAVVEWGGDHRMPVKSADVERVVESIFEVAMAAGGLPF